MAGFTAFYGANVLYPADLRNVLMHLALIVDKHAVDALVTGYEDLIPGFAAPRSKRQARASGCDTRPGNVMVTMNLRAFSALREHTFSGM